MENDDKKARIEWRQVTWYSQLLAVFLAVAIFCLGFGLGSFLTEEDTATLDTSEASGSVETESRPEEQSGTYNLSYWSENQQITIQNAFAEPRTDASTTNGNFVFVGVSGAGLILEELNQSDSQQANFALYSSSSKSLAFNVASTTGPYEVYQSAFGEPMVTTVVAFDHTNETGVQAIKKLQFGSENVRIQTVVQLESNETLCKYFEHTCVVGVEKSEVVGVNGTVLYKVNVYQLPETNTATKRSQIREVYLEYSPTNGTLEAVDW